MVHSISKIAKMERENQDNNLSGMINQTKEDLKVYRKRMQKIKRVSYNASSCQILKIFHQFASISGSQ